MGFVAAKKEFFIEIVGIIEGGIRKDIFLIEGEFGGFTTEPVGDVDGTDGGNMDIGKVGNGSFKIYRSVFGKFGSGKLFDFGVLGNITGDGDID